MPAAIAAVQQYVDLLRGHCAVTTAKPTSSAAAAARTAGPDGERACAATEHVTTAWCNAQVRSAQTPQQ